MARVEKVVRPRGGFTPKPRKTFWQFVGEGIGMLALFTGVSMLCLVMGNCAGCVDMAEIIHGKADVHQEGGL